MKNENAPLNVFCPGCSRANCDEHVLYARFVQIYVFGSTFIFVFVLLYVDIFRVFAIVLSTRHVPDVRNVSCGAGGHLGCHQLLPGLHHQIVIFSDIFQLVLAFLLPTNHISKHPNNNAANFRSRPLPSPP